MGFYVSVTEYFAALSVTKSHVTIFFFFVLMSSSIPEFSTSVSYCETFNVVELEINLYSHYVIQTW